MSEPASNAAQNEEDIAAEDQDELDAVIIRECGETLVDFLQLCPDLILSPVHPVFEFPRVHMVRESVAKMLCEAAARVPAGLRLQIVEGYRPIAVQRAHYKRAYEEAQKRFPGADEAKIQLEAGRYSAPPDAITPPPHLTGGAVDLELIDANGERLDFTSPFNLFDMKRAAMHARGLSPQAEKNRALLREILEPTGLTNYADEWWHWSYGDNGWALRVGAPNAIYNRIELPTGAQWIGDLDKLPAQD
ncbi:D-alanyl-D-alanine dipeptidase [Abditibacterium utsteinense]|uniref:D-alanyl-D-alanine dipeptidase n=1 Tax=Abditibacterium utsteinense TaxID=1960156 RepID=A0A2S8SV48_9BACT|nr:M15 family metallopeptidase [Abditibacterium utsteinense]PQV64662.1 D-alanyl-D-alanine dipeptidase [Abditibacterium utsteinense]